MGKLQGRRRRRRAGVGLVPLMIAAVALLLAARTMPGPSATVDQIAETVAGVDGCSSRTAVDARKAVERFRAELEQGNIALADAALPEARLALEKAAMCFPARAQTWLVLARMEALEEGATPKLSRLIGLSCKVAPTQSWTARDRLTMFGHLAEALDVSARECLERDRRLLARTDGARGAGR